MSIIESEISSLTQPISESAPTGVDPRHDVSPTSHYYTYKDVRNNARTAERKALIDDNKVLINPKDWRPILENIPKLLIEETKDLEFCSWLIEALCRSDGFKGLTFGFNLISELIEKYWDDIYPTPEDELGDRLAPLVGLNGIDGEGSLIVPIKAIHITDCDNEYTLFEYDLACEIDRLKPEAKEERLKDGTASMEQFMISVKQAPDSFYIELASDIEEAIESFKNLSSVMDKAMDGEPQPTSYITNTLNTFLLAVRHISKDVFKKIENEKERERYALEHSGDEDSDVDADDQSSGKSSSSGLDGQINNRENALTKLKEIAGFFRISEPHSPMSYGIEQIVYWASLSLPQLLDELIVDDDARMTYFKLSGIPDQEGGSGSGGGGGGGGGGHDDDDDDDDDDDMY
ncbi:MAG: type VI secretion system protein TssA [Psychromonas sp.]|nr:type VI secretion system protein TssA [Psychromonas sp.]